MASEEPSLVTQRTGLPRQVTVLGFVSLFTAMSSAMVYGVLPVFMVRVLGATMASVGLIEGTAEGLMSLARIGSGRATDWMGRRKPLVLFGYAVSAFNKIMFPLASSLAVVLAARTIDRIGKGFRDAPRDAFMTDVTPARVRGSGFGFRLTFYTAGYVIGPLAAMGLMAGSGGNFRLVFWMAIIPAALAILILFYGIEESAPKEFAARPFRLTRRDLALFDLNFWWTIATGALLALARFTPSFLILKAHDIGLDATYVPLMLIVMHLVYSAAAYPFGILADRLDRGLQLMMGAVVLMGADVVLSAATNSWLVGTGACLWGLQMAITQGLLSASVADAAPVTLRGTAFGIYDVCVGLSTFVANFVGGVLWAAGGAGWTFAFSAMVAAGVLLSLLLQTRAKDLTSVT